MCKGLCYNTFELTCILSICKCSTFYLHCRVHTSICFLLATMQCNFWYRALLQRSEGESVKHGGGNVDNSIIQDIHSCIEVVHSSMGQTKILQLSRNSLNTNLMQGHSDSSMSPCSLLEITKHKTKLNTSWMSFGGYLVERWVQGCAAHIGRHFQLLRFTYGPFFIWNWFRYRYRFCKMLNFRWIYLAYYLCIMHPTSLHGKKYWFVLKKRALQETNGLDVGCKFSSSLV